MVFNIYLTNLGKYNEGELVGKWVSLPTANGFEEHLEEIGINEEYEEWFISDYETDIEGLEVGEYDNIEELDELAAELESLDDYDAKAFSAFIECGYSFNEALENVQNGNYRIYSNCQDMEDVAMEVVKECGYLDQMPENLRFYFDYKAFGRDLDIEGTFIYVDGDYIELFR